MIEDKFMNQIINFHDDLFIFFLLIRNANIYYLDYYDINYKLKSCNGFGEFNNKEKFSIYSKKPDNIFYYIDHFCFKSTEEFINKLNRGSAFYGKANNIKLRKIGWYFGVNKITSKKIDYLEKKTNVNLTMYRNKISKVLLL